MADVSRAEYLKRYMSKDELAKADRKKKSKKIKRSKDSKLKIIDDDLDIKRKKTGEAAFDDELNEEAPTVAEIIDERPKHIQQLEEYRKSSRWKVLGDDEDETSAFDYGVISEKHSRLQGSDSEKDNPPSRRRHDTSYSDSSPPRTNLEAVKHNNKKTGRKPQRHDSDSDHSSIKKDRNPAKDSSPDNSPPRKRPTKAGDHPDSDSDASPPRKQKTKNQTGKPSSLNSQKVSNAHLKNSALSDSDNSPPRRGRRHDSEPDSTQSPQKKNRLGSSDSDQSPPRKSATSSNVDLSPPRHDSGSSDQSPPRKKQIKLSSNKNGNDSQDRRMGSDSGNSRYDSNHQDEGLKKAAKTLGGAKAGLSSAKEMREEAKKLRAKEDRSFQNIGDEKLGRNAKTVVRDKETGKRRDLKAEEAKNEEEEKKKKEQMEKYQQWGRGLKQQAMKDSRLQDHIHEASKPLARLKDDKDLDEMLRQEERLEDPMFNFIRKKKEKEALKSGKNKQKELPRYKGPAPPPNRYNILPGYRWDGVDRSNGFEKKLFASQANKKAIQEIAYKWSTEDM